MENPIKHYVLAVLLALPLLANAQYIGLITSGAGILNNATMKIFTPNPEDVKGVDRAQKEREFEGKIANLPPEQQAYAREQFRKVMGLADFATDMERQQAQAIKDKPIINGGEIVANMLNEQMMWGSVGMASTMNRAGVDNMTIINVMNDGAAPSPIGSPGSKIHGGMLQVMGTTASPNSFSPLQIAGFSVKDATCTQVKRMLAERGLTALAAGRGMDRIAILLDKPNLPSSPSRVKLGFDPESQKVALVSYEYDAAGRSKVIEISQSLEEQYGKPTSRSTQGGTRKFDWQLGGGETISMQLERGGMVVTFANEPRARQMNEAWQVISKTASSKR